MLSSFSLVHSAAGLMETNTVFITLPLFPMFTIYDWGQFLLKETFNLVLTDRYILEKIFYVDSLIANIHNCIVKRSAVP